MSEEKDKWYCSGNFGIGTSEPYTKLHIVNEKAGPHELDGEKGYGSPMLMGKHIELAATEMWGLKKAYGILHTWHSDSLFIGIKDEDEDEEKGRKDAVIAFGDDSDDCLRFLFTSFGNPPPKPKELLKITSKGNVGIGEINPSAKLEINLLNDDGWKGNLKGIRLRAPDNNYFLDINTYFVEGGNVGYQFSPNSTNGLVITTPGNVGIGTTKPSYTLDVKGKAIKLGLEENGGGN